MICFDDPNQELRTRIVTKAREALEKLRSTEPHERLCSSFASEENVKLYIGNDMLQKLGHSQPKSRLRQAIEYIRLVNQSKFM